MAEKKETTLKVVNPVYNKSGELITFDGIKLLPNKTLDKTDAKSMELVEAIKKLPRTNLYTGSSAPSVVINGTTYRLSYKFYTKEEVDTYNSYRDNHSSGNGGSKPKAKTLSEEEIAAWEEVRKACKDNKAALAAFEFIRPKTADELEIAALEAKLAALKAKMGK